MSDDPTKPFNEQTLQLIQDTHPIDGPITLEKVGRRFSIKKDPEYWKNFEEQRASDGIGTKGKLHWQMRTFSYGTQDAAAMVFDDLIEGGFTPYEMQNHIIVQEEDREAIYSIVKSLRDICLKYRWKVDENNYNPVIISGGETAISNTIEGMEIGICATGKVKKGKKIFPNPREGDVLIGLKSSGLHSNGFKFVRKLIFDDLKLELESELDHGATVGEELTKPTTIYLPAIKNLLDESREYVDGLVHITGGAFTKLKELTRGLFNIIIEKNHQLQPQPIFKFIYERGKVSDEEMYMRFNDGIGYGILVDRYIINDALDILEKHHEADIIGYVKKGEGQVKIKSQFSDKTIIF